MTAIRDSFKATLRAIHDDKVLTPITHAVLLDPKFKGFTVDVEAWTPRPYDGMFHPSTHAEWTTLQLYFYLTQPNLLEVEQMGLTSVLAITQGKFWHSFLQLLWLAHGVLTQDEVPLRDELHNRIGHMDGKLTDGDGLEIKTINDFKLPKIFDADTLRVLKPGYYAQTQDYLDMAGLTAMRYFMISTSYPYPTSEFVVPADPPFQAAQRAKYRAAIDAAAGTRALPQPCCALKSAQARSCPVRGACDIGRAS